MSPEPLDDTLQLLAGAMGRRDAHDGIKLGVQLVGVGPQRGIIRPSSSSSIASWALDAAETRTRRGQTPAAGTRHRHTPPATPSTGHGKASRSCEGMHVAAFARFGC